MTLNTNIMKKITLALFLIFSFHSVFATCISNMSFFPEQKEISLNSMFIIEGYLSCQETINSFKERKVYLESENGELIELILQEILKGEVDLTQAIFKPIEELKPNTIYSLRYSDQTETEERQMVEYNSELKKWEKVYWKTTDKKTMPLLNPSLNIKFKNTEFELYGCGPSSNAIFLVENKPENEIWYKTEVVTIESNKKTVYYIKDSQGRLEVGRDMCSGAFRYKDKGKYKVRFIPMNTDGERLKTTSWTTFNSPSNNYKEFY